MENPKLRAYNRYRKFANGILLGSVLALAALLSLEALGFRQPVISFLSYLAEAVLVASVADFIAILALTKPIPGLKFTGLIQKKRAELIQGFVAACETRILPKQKILQMVKEHDIVQLIKQHLDAATINEEAPAVGKATAAFLLHESPRLARDLARRIISRIGAIDTGHLLVKVEQLAVREGWVGAIVRRLMDTVAAQADTAVFVAELEAKIRTTVGKNRLGGGVVRRLWISVKMWAGEKSDTINYHELAAMMAAALREVLEKVKADGTDSEPWLEMERFAGDLVRNLAGNRIFISELQAWQAEVVSEERLAAQIEKLLVILAEWLRDGRLTSREVNDTLKFQLLNEEAEALDINRWLAALVLNGLAALEKNDAVVQAEFGKLADAFVQKEYTAVLEIIRDVLSRLSDRGLVEKVHEVAGSNLQWLRISGAYIGLATGLLLYLVSTWPLYGLPVLVLVTLGILFVKPVQRRLVILSR